MNGKKDGAERERTMDSVVARGVAAYWRVWSMKGAFAMPMESLGCRRGVLRGGDAVRRWARSGLGHASADVDADRESPCELVVAGRLVSYRLP